MKVFLDAGHGGKDSGAVGNGLLEKDLTLKIVKLIIEKLKSYNVSVYYSRLSDQTLTLQQRCNLANSVNADLFVSVHVNAGGGYGYEDYIYSGSKNNPKNIRLQNCFKCPSFFRDRGHKAANFQVLKGTKMPAILTENGFIDSVDDTVKLKTEGFLNQIADMHVNAIVSFLNLKKTETDNKIYYVSTGTVRGIETAEQVAANIRKLGYIATIHQG